MRNLLIAVMGVVLVGCATKTGNQRHAEHNASQVKMVAVQREAKLQERQAEAQANEKLYEALARVAESNPDHAPSVAVALAVIGVSGGQSGAGDTDRTIALQPMENEALRWAEALAPTVGGLVTGLGVAAINADVAKTQSNNAAKVQINDALQDSNIVNSVAALGTAAANSVGVSVGGNYYDLEGQASIDNSVTTTTTSTSTTTTTSVADSYNSQSSDTNLSQGDNGILNTGEYSDPYSYTETNETNSTSLTNTVTTDTTVTYGGSDMTLGELISYLQGLGSPYSLSIGGEVVASSTSGTGTTTTVDCSIPQFSPQHPDCV